MQYSLKLMNNLRHFESIIFRLLITLSFTTGLRHPSRNPVVGRNSVKWCLDVQETKLSKIRPDVLFTFVNMATRTGVDLRTTPKVEEMYRRALQGTQLVRELTWQGAQVQ